MMDCTDYYVFLLDISTNEILEINEKDKNEILERMYFLQLRPFTLEESKKSKNKKLNEILKKKTFNEINNEIKIKISNIESHVPLYDVYTENIYLIKKYNVYTRVVHQHYRFPEKKLLEEIENNKKINEKYIQPNDKLLLRKIKKNELLLNFMAYFDLDILFGTYTKVFYKYSSFVGKETTVCKNPSFLPEFYHIKPYLTRSEVINFALNFGLKLSENYIEPEEINKICNKITKYQIDSQVLLKHQHHILNSNYLGLVQYYTLQGSFFMNQYLRNLTVYNQQNEYLESLISPMWNLVLTAPKFDKQYIVYRFVGRDDYLKNTKIGEIYTEKGFMSTTRDPFYRADLYKFGFILIKIKIPSDKVGVALCLETISHFPEEQEIIFPPNSKFKLISRDDNCEYYHTDINFMSKIKTKYEFEWVENSKITFERTIKFEENRSPIDFLKLKQISSISLIEKIKHFDNLFVNDMGQFKVNLADKEIIVLTEWFDSSGAYKNYYALETTTGYSMYSIYKGYILFYIEFAELKEGKQMHVNYYVKYSSVDASKVIGNDNLIKFFSSVAHYFDIHNVVIYANYLNCGTELIQSGGIRQREYEGTSYLLNSKNNSNNLSKLNNLNSSNNSNNKIGIMGGSYCNDIYQYLLNGKKMYAEDGILSVELQPKFSYHDLNYLKKQSPKEILQKIDRDELFQLYDKFYKDTNKLDNIADFYLWLIEENKCHLLDILINKIDKLLGKNNPFKNDIYILDSATYLYNRKYIQTYPTNISINPTIKRSIIKQGITETKFDEFRNK